MKRLHHGMPRTSTPALDDSRQGSVRCRRPHLFGACPGSRQMIQATREQPVEPSKRTGWRWRTVPWLSGHREASVRQVLRFARDDMREWSEERQP